MSNEGNWKRGKGREEGEKGEEIRSERRAQDADNPEKSGKLDTFAVNVEREW